MRRCLTRPVASPYRTPAVLRVFAITGMDKVIPNFTSLDEALASAAATANGRSSQHNEADGAPEASRPRLAPAGELPRTLKRSSKEAQETFTMALARAVQVYGEGDQANRAAYAEFKRTFEKRDDHWIQKQPTPWRGPSARSELKAQPDCAGRCSRLTSRSRRELADQVLHAPGTAAGRMAFSVVMMHSP